MFMPREVVEAALPRIVRELKPSGMLGFGMYVAWSGPLGRAVTDFATIRSGGHPRHDDEIAQPARAAGSRTAFFSDVTANFLDRYLTLQLFDVAPRGFSFVTRVGLHDGSSVTFSAPLPYEHITRFYVLLPKLALMLAIVIGLMFVALRWITQPMRKMAQAALALGQDLDRPPIAESGPEEIRATARALNVMQLRLQDYVRDRATMLAALSHDLKTFITRLRLRSELRPEGVHRDRLIGDLGSGLMD